MIFLLVAAVLVVPASAKATWVQPSDQRIGAGSASVTSSSLVGLTGDLFLGQVENTSGNRAILGYRLTTDGQGWSTVGAPLGVGASAGAAGIQLATSPTSVLATWQQEDAGTGVLSVYAKRFDPGVLPEVWQPIGSELNIDPTRNASAPTPASYAGVPYVAFVQATPSARALRLVRFDGSDWVSVGGSANRSATSDASKPKLVALQNSLGLTWIEALGSDRNAFVTQVAPTTGTPTPLGTAVNLPEGSARECDLTELAGATIAACLVDTGASTKFYVKRFDVLSGEWELLGGALNAGSGDASSSSVANIDGSLYALHSELLGGVYRSILSRFDDVSGQWDLLPEFVGSENDSLPELKSIEGLPLVSIAAGAGGGRAFQLAPSVTNFSIRAAVDSADGAAYADTYGLPYSLQFAAVAATGEVTGSLEGVPPEIGTSFAGLAAATPYDAKLRATDPFGRKYIVGDTAFVTDARDVPGDDDQPLVALTFQKRTTRPPRIRGSASDDGSGVSAVEVALESRTTRGCSWISTGLFVERRCDSPAWLRINSGQTFSYQLTRKQLRRIMRTSYEVYARSIDAAGNVSEIDAYRCTRYRHRRADGHARRISKCSVWQ